MEIFKSIPHTGPQRIISIIKFIQEKRTPSESLLEKVLFDELNQLPQNDKGHHWKILFPEGLLDNDPATIETIRKKRSVRIEELNQNPIRDLAQEFLITSNVLLDLPIDCDKVSDPDLKIKLREIKKSCKQKYWYDHPIPMDTLPQNNEIIYELKQLNQAVAFEKKIGIFPKNKKLTCLLSLSTTYKELAPLAKKYLQLELDRSKKLEHLALIAFSEDDSKKLINEILQPLAKKYQFAENTFSFLGVDGEYGRHYSFLKSITAFIQACYNSKLKGSFKIDLDQVFFQEKLMEETGQSALSHFLSPLWGATATDLQGNSKELGMIAGTLVNQVDAETSLFSPDVKMPTHFGTGETQFFCSQIPQAISTVAEMMPCDNIRTRIHVTGGTNGILVSSLKKYRPFTPSFVGRAEDQAYILSTFDGNSFPLAYLHKSGLVMRHDKEGFAAEAIAKAKIGKTVGDYQRILIYSAYARYLDPTLEKIKEELAPFTGCFISKYPLLLALLRLITKVQSLNDKKEAEELATMGLARIEKTLDFVTNDFENSITKEKQEYDSYYDLLHRWHDDTLLKDKANAIINNCYLT